jgi:hypothetical protein
MVCVGGGYKTVTPVQIANCFGALERAEICYREVRVYFACHCVAAVREATARSATKRGKEKNQRVRFRLSEIASLARITEKQAKRSVRRLRAASLLSWSENALTITTEKLAGCDPFIEKISGKRSPFRPIPFPRPVLRLIARSPGSVGKTALGYALRGLSIDR